GNPDRWRILPCFSVMASSLPQQADPPLGVGRRSGRSLRVYAPCVRDPRGGPRVPGSEHHRQGKRASNAALDLGGARGLSLLGLAAPTWTPSFGEDRQASWARPIGPS